MRAHLLRRLGQFLPVRFGALVSFAIVRLAPGDPAALMVDVQLLSEEERLSGSRTP